MLGTGARRFSGERRNVGTVTQPGGTQKTLEYRVPVPVGNDLVGSVENLGTQTIEGLLIRARSFTRLFTLALRNRIRICSECRLTMRWWMKSGTLRFCGAVIVVQELLRRPGTEPFSRMTPAPDI